ncbi:hypothetical protein PT974_08119 [Cladobotryum mycophilum]|uniref:Uncharacterized protein n=1 Tax=Cladobotryum mycophilum TaxID=491253 RepID=A0ABR0SCG3_9HYPO
MMPSHSKRSGTKPSAPAKTGKKPTGKTCNAHACNKAPWTTTRDGKSYDSNYCREHARCHMKGCKTEIKTKLPSLKWYCPKHQCSLKQCSHPLKSATSLFCEYHEKELAKARSRAEGSGPESDSDSTDRSNTWIESDDAQSPRRAAPLPTLREKRAVEEVAELDSEGNSGRLDGEVKSGDGDECIEETCYEVKAFPDAQRCVGHELERIDGICRYVSDVVMQQHWLETPSVSQGPPLRSLNRDQQESRAPTWGALKREAIHEISNLMRNGESPNVVQMAFGISITVVTASLVLLFVKLLM